MTIIKCDNCSEACTNERIEIKGVATRSGILLLAHLRTFDFCSQKCAVEWLQKFVMPDPKSP